MPTPISGQTIRTKELDGVAVRYKNEQEEYIIGDICPDVKEDMEGKPIPRKGEYPEFTRDAWFRDNAEQIGQGKASPVSGFNIKWNNYKTKLYGHTTVFYDDDVGVASKNLKLTEKGFEFSEQKCLLHQEVDGAALMFNESNWGSYQTGGTDIPKWSDYAESNPIKNIRGGGVQIKGGCAKKPTDLVLGFEAYLWLLDHPDILARMKVTDDKIMNMARLASIMDLKRVHVGEAVLNTAPDKGPSTESWSSSFIWGRHALLMYKSDTPSQGEISAAYALTSQEEETQIIRDDVHRASGFEVTYMKDQQIICKYCGHYFKDIVDAYPT